MTKRASLFGKAQPQPVEPAAPDPALAPMQEAEAARKYPVAKTREGKRVATVYLEPEALRQLKRIGFDEEKTVQELLTEGVNAVFEKRGLSRIA
jgi:hypothetical protein